MRKRLVIVGNAPLESDFTQLVDSSEFVVRFNLCVNFAKHTGTRTDALCLNNTGKPARDLAARVQLSNCRFAQDASEIWFPRPRQSAARRLLERLRPVHNDLEYSAAIIAAHGWEGKRIEYLIEQQQHELWAKLLAQGKPRFKPRKPSSGMIAIEYVLSEKRFADYEKVFLGFTFQGWKRHPWDLEQRLIETYLARQQLGRAA